MEVFTPVLVACRSFRLDTQDSNLDLHQSHNITVMCCLLHYMSAVFIVVSCFLLTLTVAKIPLRPTPPLNLSESNGRTIFRCEPDVNQVVNTLTEKSERSDFSQF